VIASSSPPVPQVAAVLALGGVAVDLSSRVLVAGVVPAPRFGRESEVVATARAVAAAGADLLDVSLPPRMIGPVAAGGTVPVMARCSSIDESAAAIRAGAAVVAVSADLAREVVAHHRADEPTGGRSPARDATIVVIVDDLARLAGARALAEQLGLALAVDSPRGTGAGAIAHEAMAVAEGCRLIRTFDVRRSRRVAEVMGAVLAARRPDAAPTPPDDSEAPR
jgi:hypothetical protein